MAAVKYEFTKRRFAVGASLGGYGKFADKQATAAYAAGAGFNRYEAGTVGAMQFAWPAGKRKGFTVQGLTGLVDTAGAMQLAVAA